MFKNLFLEGAFRVRSKSPRLFSFLYFLLAGLWLYPALAQSSFVRVSENLQGVAGNGPSFAPVISGDGQVVAFASDASNLVAGDSNGRRDIFVRDFANQTLARISQSNLGVQGDGDSYNPSISSDGRWVAFVSAAENLSLDGNGQVDGFLYDRLRQTIQRVAPLATSLRISGNGQVLAFTTGAALLPQDQNNHSDVYLRDLRTNQLILVSRNPNGVASNQDSFFERLSTDGNRLVFASFAFDLVSGDTNGTWDLFLFDRESDSLQRVSVSSSGKEQMGAAAFILLPAISGDGSAVAFASLAGNLVSEDENGWWDVFVRDPLESRTERVSVDSSGAEQGNQETVGGPSLSENGRLVAFSSTSADLAPGAGNGFSDVFLHDRFTGRTTLVTSPGGGSSSNGDSGNPSLNARGDVLVFQSGASNLVPGDGPTIDIFLRRLEPLFQDTLVASVSPWGVAEGEPPEVTVRASSLELPLLEAKLYELVPLSEERRLVVTLNDTGSGADEQAGDGLFSGTALLSAPQHRLAEMVVEGELERTDGGRESVESDILKLELVTPEAAFLSPCQGLERGLGYFFGRKPASQDRIFPFVPFMNLSFFQDRDLLRPEAPCDAAGMDRLMSAFWRPGEGPQPANIPAGDDSGDEPSHRDSVDIREDLKKTVEEIEKDKCINKDDRQNLIKLLNLFDEIDDPWVVLLALQQVDWPGPLAELASSLAFASELAKRTQDLELDLYRKPVRQILSGLEERRNTSYKGPDLNSICWHQEENCTVIEVDVNRKFSVTLGAYGAGMDIEFLKDHYNTGKHVLRVCPDPQSIEVVSGSVRLDFDLLEYILPPELAAKIEDFFLGSIVLTEDGGMVTGWTNDIAGPLSGLGIGRDVKGEPLTYSLDSKGDEDQDSMSDAYEVEHPCLDPQRVDHTDDPDEDGFPTFQEKEFGSDPCVPTLPADPYDGLIDPLTGRPLGAAYPQIDRELIQLDLRSATPIHLNEEGRHEIVIESRAPLDPGLFDSPPTEPFASWYYFIDLDGRRDTGFPGNLPPVKNFPEMGVDAMIQIQLGPHQFVPQGNATATFDSRLFLGAQDIRYGTPCPGIVSTQLSPAGNEIHLELAPSVLENALSDLALQPSAIDLRVLRYGAASRLCLEEKDCSFPFTDVLPEGEAAVIPPIFFSQFGNGAEGTVFFSSQLRFLTTNLDRNQNLQVSLFDDTGSPLSLNLLEDAGGPFGQVNPPEGVVPLTLPAGGGVTRTTDGSGPLRTGSVRVDPDTGSSGVILFDAGAAGFAGVGPGRASRRVVVPVLAGLGRQTGLALVATAPGQMIDLSFLDSAGVPLATSRVELSEMAHVSQFLPDFAWTPALSFPEIGSLEMVSQSPFAAMAIVVGAGRLATLPVVDLETLPPVSVENEYRLLLAQFGDGRSGDISIASELTLLSLDSEQSTSARIQIRDDLGQPLSVDLNGVEISGETEIEVPARGIVRLRTDGQGVLQAGSVEVLSDVPLAGFVFFEAGVLGTAGVGSSRPVTGFAAPVMTAPGIDSGLAVTNPGLPQEVELELRNLQGEVVSSVQLGLASGGRFSRFLTELDWNPALDFGNFQGTLFLTSEKPVGATLILLVPGEMATFPVVAR